MLIKDKKGNLTGAKIVKLTPKKDEATGRMNMVPVEGSEKTVPAQAFFERLQVAEVFSDAVFDFYVINWYAHI